MSVIENYRSLEKEISRIANSSGSRGDVTIIAVSKTFPPEVVQQAIDAGISLFGENKVQEAKKKIPVLRGNFCFHMIGHLQSNKAKDAVRLFDLIHSIDKIETAQAVNIEAHKIEKKQKILIQVNTSGEESKSGVTPERAPQLVEEILKLDNVELLGLMAMAPFTDNRDVIRNVFIKTRELMKQINSGLGTELRELSMGMSSDYDIAVEEGATMVRIGAALFGERRYS
ncbi:MAG TPA: YggS family pyridoxal phosphate-dependent enzyme [Spirochaetota bacterium]|nr:YggS family pyridoxal phosphate-dependent enzyme [Spirochaetota bacterium]HPI89218.1 YggS family pyridoxal phosphate-dependent enzyme [Spirochaetota bacterium]HPR48965.1 YggS family pyridoxal phosphate-dependent enzyme [Spirochaetota bacterium]